MNSYIYDDYEESGLGVDENGKLTVNYMTDEYKRGIKEISEMMQEGLIDIQCYTQKNTTLRTLCSAEEEVVGAFAKARRITCSRQATKDFFALCSAAAA